MFCLGCVHSYCVPPIITPPPHTLQCQEHALKRQTNILFPPPVPDYVECAAGPQLIANVDPPFTLSFNIDSNSDIFDITFCPTSDLSTENCYIMSKRSLNQNICGENDISVAHVHKSIKILELYYFTGRNSIKTYWMMFD